MNFLINYVFEDKDNPTGTKYTVINEFDSVSLL